MIIFEDVTSFILRNAAYKRLVNTVAEEKADTIVPLKSFGKMLTSCSNFSCMKPYIILTIAISRSIGHLFLQPIEPSIIVSTNLKRANPNRLMSPIM